MYIIHVNCLGGVGGYSTFACFISACPWDLVLTFCTAHSMFEVSPIN